MYQEVGLWSSIWQRREEPLREARLQGLAKEGRSEGLVVREVRVMDDALLLHADPAWAGAINTVLVKKGVRVSELRPAGRIAGRSSAGNVPLG